MFIHVTFFAFSVQKVRDTSIKDDKKRRFQNEETIRTKTKQRYENNSVSKNVVRTKYVLKVTLKCSLFLEILRNTFYGRSVKKFKEILMTKGNCFSDEKLCVLFFRVQ